MVALLGAIAGVVALPAVAGADGTATGPEPTVTFSTTDTIALSAKKPAASVTIVNGSGANRAVVLQLQNVAGGTLESNPACAPPETQGSATVVAGPVALQPGSSTCVIVRIDPASISASTGSLIVFSDATGPVRRSVTVAGATPAVVAPPIPPDTLTLNVMADGTDKTVEIPSMPGSDGSVGYVSGPGATPHLVTAAIDASTGVGVLTIEEITDVGKYSGKVDLTPSVAGGEISITVAAQRPGGIWWAISLMLAGSVVAGLIAWGVNVWWVRTKRTTKVDELRQNSLRAQSAALRILEAIFPGAGRETAVANWAQVVDRDNEADTGRALEQLLRAAEATDADDASLTTAKTGVSDYASAVRSLADLAQVRARLIAAGAKPDTNQELRARLEPALQGEVPGAGAGADRLAALKTQSATRATSARNYLMLYLQVHNLKDEIAGSDHTESEKRALEQRRNDLRTKLNAATDDAITAIQTEYAQLAGEVHGAPPASRAAVELESPPQLTPTAITMPPSTVVPASTAADTDKTLQQLTAAIESRRRSTGWQVFMLSALSLIIAIALGLPTVFYDVEGWGTFPKDFLVAFTWAFAITGTVNVVRYLAPLSWQAASKT
jgi:hypothetical protein